MSHESIWCPRCDKFEAYCERKGYNSTNVVLAITLTLGVVLWVGLMVLWGVFPIPGVSLSHDRHPATLGQGRR